MHHMVSIVILFFLFFFFQAEDGIRDYKVTGVQTCALPIFDFLNKSVMGSMFSRYKTPALVNLDFHVTFTPQLLRKDMDLGLDAGRRFEVPMPLAALTRDLIQQMIGHGMTEQDFSTLLLMQARASGIELKPENVAVGDGLSS